MGRWEPDARGRLLRAAIDLFSEHGYEAVTAAAIADRAGLTRATLFRLFPDKREILFQGQDVLVALASEGVRAAPVDATGTGLLRAGITALTDAHSDEQRVTGRRLEPIVASSQELRERAVFKRSAITTALADALAARLGDRRRAGVLADLGIRAYYDGFASWAASDDGRTLSEVVSEELAALEAAARQLTAPASITG